MSKLDSLNEEIENVNEGRFVDEEQFESDIAYLKKSIASAHAEITGSSWTLKKIEKKEYHAAHEKVVAGLREMEKILLGLKFE